jgi:hypothetical protein
MVIDAFRRRPGATIRAGREGVGTLLLWICCFLFGSSNPVSAQQRFDHPAVEGVAVDWCLAWGADCGQPAADRFCRDHGSPAAVGFAVAEDVGRTVIQSTGQLCEDPRCDGFAYIECGVAGRAERGAAGRSEAVPTENSRAVTRREPPRSLRNLDELPPERRIARIALVTAPALGKTRLQAQHGPARGPGEDSAFSGERLQLDWNRTDRLRASFRWKTDVTGAAGALWEISTSSFPLGGGGNVRPPGYLESGRLGAPSPSGQWQTFAVDLAPFSPWPAGTRPVGEGFFHVFDPARVRPKLFLRVRVTDAEGKFVGNPSHQVILAFDGSTPGKLSKPKPADNLPVVELVRWQPLQPYAFDFQCRGIVRFTPPGMLGAAYKEGEKLNLCEGDDSSWFEDFANGIADGFGSLFDFAGSIVNWVSEAYADAKGLAMGVVTDALASTVGCPEYCEWAVSTGIDAGLAAMGIPPSLPNFDQMMADLEQQGVQALAGTVVQAAASQGIDVPPAVAEAAVQQLVSEAKKSASGGVGGPAASFIGIDPAALYHPAVLVLEVSNRDPARPTVPINLQLDNSSPTTGSSLFMLSGSPIPALQPGTSIPIAFELTPNYDPARWMESLPTGADFKYVTCGSPPKGLNIFDPASFQDPAFQKWKACKDIAGSAPGYTDFGPFFQKQAEAKARLDEWVQTYTNGTRTFRVGLETNPGVYKDVAVLKCPAQGSPCSMGPAGP